MTGGDTHHYTNEDVSLCSGLSFTSIQFTDVSIHNYLCLKHEPKEVENPGIDPGASRMQSERSSI